MFKPIDVISDHISNQAKTLFVQYVGYMKSSENDLKRIDPGEYAFNPSKKRVILPNFICNQPETMIAVGVLYHCIINLEPKIILKIQQKVNELSTLLASEGDYSNNEQFQNIDKLFEYLLPKILSVEKQNLPNFLEQILQPYTQGQYSPIYNAVEKSDLNQIFLMIMEHLAIDQGVEQELTWEVMTHLINEWIGVKIEVLTEDPLIGLKVADPQSIYFYRNEKFDERFQKSNQKKFDQDKINDKFELTFKYHLKDILIILLTNNLQNNPFEHLLSYILKKSQGSQSENFFNLLFQFESKTSQEMYASILNLPQQILDQQIPNAIQIPGQPGVEDPNTTPVKQQEVDPEDPFDPESY